MPFMRYIFWLGRVTRRLLGRRSDPWVASASVEGAKPSSGLVPCQYWVDMVSGYSHHATCARSCTQPHTRHALGGVSDGVRLSKRQACADTQRGAAVVAHNASS